MSDNEGTLVVREIKNDGMQDIFFLPASNYTLYEFQMWFFGVNPDGNALKSGTERNEILAYYPDGLPEEMHTYGHPAWADPDGLPSRYEKDD